MSTRCPRVLVAALFCLLEFAALAQAECAWVLWGLATGKVYEKNATTGKTEVSTVGRLPDPWVAEAFPTYQDCQRALAARTPTDKENQLVHTFTFGQKEVWVASKYICLPDTVDPRGPKGK
jgi:hypothetical protein